MIKAMFSEENGENGFDLVANQKFWCKNDRMNTATILLKEGIEED